MIFCVLRICGPITAIDKQVYYSIGRSDIGLYYEIGLLIANVTMLLITVPIGIGAIAIGALIVEYIGSLVVFFISRKVFQYSLRERFRNFLKPTINALIMVLAMLAVSLFGLSNIFTLILQCIIGVSVYLTMTKIKKDDNLNYILNLIIKK